MELWTRHCHQNAQNFGPELLDQVPGPKIQKNVSKYAQTLLGAAQNMVPFQKYKKNSSDRSKKSVAVGSGCRNNAAGVGCDKPAQAWIQHGQESNTFFQKYVQHGLKQNQASELRSGRTTTAKLCRILIRV